MKTKLKLFLSLSYIAGAVLAIFNILCYRNYVNPDNLLVTVSPVITVFSVCCSAAVVFFIAVPYFSSGNALPKESTDNSSFIIFCSSLLGFLFAGYTVSSLYSIMKNFSAFSAVYSQTEPLGNVLKVIYFAGIILAVPCAVYFIVLALQPKIMCSAKLGLLSVFPVLWCAARLICVFMQTSSQVNAAGRRISIVSLCLCVLYFLLEAKLYIPAKDDDCKSVKERSNSFRALVSVGCCAVCTLWISQISVTVLQSFWLLEPSESYLLNAIFITIILYITSRISNSTFEA